MRKPFLLLAAVALSAAACSSTSSTEPPGRQQVRRPPPGDPAALPAGRRRRRRPYDGVTYQDPGVNPFVHADRDRESTFALDVDTASYTIAQRYVADGNLPDPASVRVEEFVNAFEQDYAAPAEDDTFAISSDGGPSPFLADDEVLLRIGVKASEVARLQRPAAALTFVIDTSGSMAREDRLGLVKQALTFLVDRLRPRDTVAIVEYGTDAQVVLEPTTAKTPTGSSPPSTRCSRADRPTPRPACGWATSWPPTRSARTGSTASSSPPTASRTWATWIRPRSCSGSAPTRSRGSSS